MKQQKTVSVKSVSPEGFIAGCQKLVREEMIPYQYRVMNDCVKGVAESHVVANFVNAARTLAGEEGLDLRGMVFQDSDAAKWLEAVSYSLAVQPDKELEATADDLIAKIAAAQDRDGYLNTAYTIKNRERRWTNLLEGHELYCAGHMIEAACAYYEATGKDTLLNVMIRNAEHIYRVFLTEGHEGCPGHPEIELALLRLYRITKNEHFLALAKHFIDVRGTDSAFFRKEREKRDWQVWGMNPDNLEYLQAQCPVRKMDKAVGHAVRACYLYTAMADLAGLTDDAELKAACDRIWENITERQLYLTGGIGATSAGEAFTKDYDLPNDSVYAETCASIALIYFADRMREMDTDGKYSDVIEQAFYNTVLAGIQLDGKRYFYVNPLEVVPGFAETLHGHVKMQRPGWYACACCPPNAARMVSSYHRFAYGENETTAFCHTYVGGTASFANGVKLHCETAYPYGFTVTYRIEKGGRLAVHIPAWSRTYDAVLNGKKLSAALEKGYLYLDVSDGDVLRIVLDGTPRFVTANAKVPALTGMTALCRGPLVYCFEGADNEGDVLSLSLKLGGTVTETENTDLPQPIVKLCAEAVRMKPVEGLYSDELPQFEHCAATAIPYYAWANRGAGQMRVWMNRYFG